MNMASAVGLCLAVSLAASGCAGSLGTAQTASPCPPRAQALGAQSSSPNLAAGGRGVLPREVPPADEGVTAEPATPRLVSGGKGVEPRLETPSSQRPSQGPSTSSTPRLIAGPRGTAETRPDCD